MSQFRIGQTVETSAGQQGVVKYVGPIHFANGTYVGIELATADGKNDGSVRGQRYFTCAEDHGLFVKSSSNLRVVRAAARTRSATSTTATTASTSTTITTATRRPSVTRVAPRLSTNQIESLQTRIKHLEKQHSEDQECIRELVLAKEERDRFKNLLEKLQNKCQVQHTELQELKQNLRDAQNEHEILTRNTQENEITLEDALVEKEMAQLRAETAEAEFESLRSQLQERDEELEILRQEAELYTAEMTEEERQEVGYYRLQHDNDRMREALLSLKEMTEEREQDLKSRIDSLESDLTNLDAYARENASLQQRVTDADAIIDDLRQRLEAASEWEDMMGEISNQNHDLQDRIAEQNLHIQDLENIRELNDELEVQHLEQQEELRAELDSRDIELAEQARHIVEQSAIIADHETLIAKFRDLVIDLQNKAMDAESSKTMTEAMVRDTTGKFNEVMDVNRQLRTATVQSTARKIDHDLAKMELDLSRRETALWSEGAGREFIMGEANQAYVVTKRLDTKCKILKEALFSTQKQMSHGGRLDDAYSQLNICDATVHLNNIEDRNCRLQWTMHTASLAQFTAMGSIYQDLLTLEQVLDEGLNSVKTDAINFDELPSSLMRSSRTYEAILASQHEILCTRPENEISARAAAFETRLWFIKEVFAVLTWALAKVPDSVQREIRDVQETLREQINKVDITYERARKFAETLRALRQDGLYCPMNQNNLEELAEFEEKITNASGETCEFARKLIAELITCSTSAASETVDSNVAHEAGKAIVRLQDAQSEFLWSSYIGLLSGSLDIWITQVSSLLYCVEIPQGPTPWAQKAKLRNEAVKLGEELGRQLDEMRAERRATLLKIHEREEIIATKDLEIEHLMAKNRDAATKAEAVDTLKAQIMELEDKITDLQRTQESQSQIIREVDTEDMDEATLEARVVVDPLPTYAEPVEFPLGDSHTPPGMAIMLEALQNENHWLRQRAYKDQFENNLLDYFYKLGGPRSNISYRSTRSMMLEDMSDDEDFATPPVSPPLAASTASPISLEAIQLSLDGRQHGLKEAIEARAWLTTIAEEEDDESVFG
ncbi:hypothetical protein IAQ61_008923 [Plenodomus lingam]|uniref:CAP-Gly domain-containing protein n=1 Tax=Leptosphaeria maculans (strain JN3 / isolate v23.1.3 / race Av1-4-5-6-7-8) TaxID=985895 RepID=E4ZPH4_LEPMJ|nr:hypothetical protein LEMA_P041000.1 [Plenodomus lingam JN3]KAH9864977.1 hypothetical protein IAQ61_008923 [Plenodomus lingam]CBX93199.1 hypothetical protein LEMA_P041000.1 [Plenodomus lingam JN3]